MTKPTNNQIALATSLASYVSDDDWGLPRDEFLTYVRDRISDDLLKSRDRDTHKLGPNDRAEYCGYTIVRKKDMPEWETNIGYVVTKRGCNIMPGATWFKTLPSAHKGIAAHALACKIAPKPDGDGCDGDTFWHLMRLAGER